MRLFGGDRMLNIVDKLGIDEDMTIDNSILSNSIETSQKRREDVNFRQRKNTLEYDDVMNQQRQVIYKQRRDVLEGADITAKIKSMIDESVGSAVTFATAEENREDWNLDILQKKFGGWLVTPDDIEFASTASAEEISERLLEKAHKIHEDKATILQSEELARELERICLLRNVDKKWIEHLEAMDDLKGGVSLNAYASRNPLTEYRIQGADLFDAMIDDIREGTVRDVLSFYPAPKREIKIVRTQVAKPLIPAGCQPQGSAAQDGPGYPLQQRKVRHHRHSSGHHHGRCGLGGAEQDQVRL